MKILYQSPSLIPSQTANSVHVMNIADEFAKMGHNVRLLVFQGNIEESQPDHLYYGVSDRFEIKKLSGSSRAGKIKFLSQSLAEAFRFKPDIIVTRFPLGAYIFALFGFKIVLDAHHPLWHGSRYKAFLYKLFRKNKNIIRITTNSGSLKDMFFASNMQPDCPIVVAHNGSKIFPKDEYYELKTKNNNIGYIGSVYKGRGVDIVIKAAEQLPEFNFHIAGGSLKEINELKKAYSVPDNVFFYGYVDPAKAYMFRNSCDLLLAPYHRSGVMTYGGVEDSSKYMNPIKVIEYMSAGKPIVASDLEPIREVLDSEVAVLADPDKVEEWVNAIERIMSNRELYEDLSKKSFDFFIDNLTWNIRAKKLIEQLPNSEIR